MFSRILGIIVCLCIIALGVLFISSSSTSNFAPMISGTAMIFITMIVLTAICISIAEDTVKRHISNVFQKLEVSDRAQATAEAIRRGIIRIDE